MVIKVSNNKGFYCWFTAVLILIISFTLFLNVCSAETNDYVAYVYQSDQPSADEYQNLLNSSNLRTTTLTTYHAANSNFSKYDVIIIGSDINLSDRISYAALRNISSSGKPIVALGYGGAYFLIKFKHKDLSRSPNSSIGIYQEEAIIHMFNSPRPIVATAGTQILLYKTPCKWMGADPLSIRSGLIGRDLSGSNRYPLAFEKNPQGSNYMYNCFLWGFTCSPDNLTEDGTSLFVNVINEMTRRYPVTSPPTTPPSAPDTPVSNGENKKFIQMIGFILVISGLLFTALTTLKKDTTIEIGISEKTLKYVGSAGILFVLIGAGLLLISSGLVTIHIGGLI